MRKGECVAPLLTWRCLGVMTVLLVAGTGCLEEWRQGGAIDRAVHKDVQADLQQQQICANGLPADWICEGKSPNKKCHWQCPK